MERINCYYTIITLVIAFGIIIIACFAMFFNYNAKLSKDGIEITKLNHRTKELEKKNGHEQHQIDELKKGSQESVKIIDNLQKEIGKLKKKLGN